MQGKKKAICTTGFIIVNIGIFLGIMLIGKDGDTTVSYTHLDVYKRQDVDSRSIGNSEHCFHRI